MAGSTVKVRGLDQLLKNMEQLPRELSSKNGGIVRSALFKATKRVRDRARQLAPKDSGALSRGVIAVRDKNPRANGASERYMIAVRIKVTKKLKAKARRNAKGKIDYRSIGIAWYWRLVEFGTRGDRISKKTGRNSGVMPAQPFLRPAFEGEKQAALSDFKEGVATGIQNAVRKMKK
jgi:HK97 gp10 family phage protein